MLVDWFTYVEICIPPLGRKPRPASHHHSAGAGRGGGEEGWVWRLCRGPWLEWRTHERLVYTTSFFFSAVPGRALIVVHEAE